jgi:enterochelin esterase-like enzyme
MKLSLVVTVAVSAASLAFAQTGAPALKTGAIKTGAIDKIKVHGRSLEGNLEGDPAERDVYVYLPPSYATNHTQRYPVVYLLQGYGRRVETWVPFIGLPSAADNDIASGTAKEMILVIPDAHTLYGGSMYSSSPTTGDWESFITNDLVSYVDIHYRTIANRDSRGLGGHSMGGYGVWRIAMKHPEVYSSIYALSACCLMNNPQVRPVPAAKQAAPPKGAPDPNDTGNVTFGEAAAWSPNPMNPPQFFDLPVKEGQLQPSIAAKWVANSPLAMADQYVPNLKKYRAIAMDVGLQDSLAGANRNFDQALTQLGVSHTFETFVGEHSDHLKDRVELKVLPFFSDNLTFPSARPSKHK